MPHSRTAIDLFCGCGGMTLGMKQAGFRVVAGVEIDEKAAKTYAANHPDTFLIQRNIRLVDPRDFKVSPGELDLLAACPPCQGFSTLKTRKTKKVARDARNNLINEVSRLAEYLLPKAIMIENVPGLALDRRFSLFVEKIASLGYTTTWHVINAHEYDVPQRRKRLILVAARFAPATVAPPSDARPTVRDTIENLPEAGKSGDTLHDTKDMRSPKVVEIIKHIPKNGGSRSALPSHLKLPCHKRSSGFGDVYGRITWDSPSPTITSGCNNPSKGRFIHPTHNRAITLREAALLQGFPWTYWFPVEEGKEAVALMIGNALPPPLIKKQAAHILKTILNKEIPK